METEGQIYYKPSEILSVNYGIDRLMSGPTPLSPSILSSILNSLPLHHGPPGGPAIDLEMKTSSPSVSSAPHEPNASPNVQANPPIQEAVNILHILNTVANILNLAAVPVNAALAAHRLTLPFPSAKDQTNQSNGPVNQTNVSIQTNTPINQTNVPQNATPVTSAGKQNLPVQQPSPNAAHQIVQETALLASFSDAPSSNRSSVMVFSETFADTTPSTLASTPSSTQSEGAPSSPLTFQTELEQIFAKSEWEAETPSAKPIDKPSEEVLKTGFPEEFVIAIKEHETAPSVPMAQMPSKPNEASFMQPIPIHPAPASVPHSETSLINPILLPNGNANSNPTTATGPQTNLSVSPISNSFSSNTSTSTSPLHFPQPNTPNSPSSPTNVIASSNPPSLQNNSAFAPFVNPMVVHPPVPTAQPGVPLVNPFAYVANGKKFEAKRKKKKNSQDEKEEEETSSPPFDEKA